MNKKTTYKLMALFLTLIMMLGVLPMTAFAADDRTPITEVEATYTFPELTYGSLSYPIKDSIAGSSISKGSEANISTLGIRKENGDAYEGVLKEGTYRYRCQLRTDNNTHVLTDDTTLKINGVSWTSTSGNLSVGNGFSYKWFLGPTFTIVKPADAPLTVPTNPVPIKEGMLFDGNAITELDASKYVSGGEGTLTFSKKSGPSWANVSNAGIVSGTATTVGVTDLLVITVTDGETTADFSVSIPEVYPLSNNRTQITEVEATYTFPELVIGSSDYPTNDLIGENFIKKGSPASISTLGIRKGDGNAYEGALQAGTYCYRCQLRTDNYTHVLTENTTLKINGVSWSSSQDVTVADNYSYMWFSSPTFTISEGGNLQKNAVTITPTANMTLSSGNESQNVIPGNAMTPVVYTADLGYYFPEDYSVTAQNGVSVTRNSLNQITVSGTPTANVSLTLIAPNPPVYTLTDGAGQTVTQGESAIFTSNADFNKFESVKIDGSVIDSSNYISAEGSTIITLSGDYTQTLSVGSHSIEIVSDDGSAAGQFIIQNDTTNEDENEDENENKNGGIRIISRGKPNKGIRTGEPYEYATPLPDNYKGAAKETNPETGVCLSPTALQKSQNCAKLSWVAFTLFGLATATVLCKKRKRGF